MLSRNTSGTRLIINAYVSKFDYFSHFWTIIGGYKCAIVTANNAQALDEYYLYPEKNAIMGSAPVNIAQV
jgi:hypothetical protein